MYCKKCGEQITQDALYCSKCGEKLIENENQPINAQTEIKKEPKGCLWFICFVIIIILIIALSVTISENFETIKKQIESASKKESEVRDPFDYEDIEKGDFDIDFIWNMENSQIIYIITPHYDISDLQINFTFYDKEGKAIHSVNQEIKSLTQNIQFTKVVSFSEISNKKDSIDKIQYRINGGKVYY